MTQFNYQSEYNGDLRIHDTNARKHLSDYAYNKLWSQNIEMKSRYQFTISSDGKSNIVWPIGEILSESNRKTIPFNSRCGCAYQLTWQCPCAHEFAIKVSFDVTHYSTRWLYTTIFDQLHPELIPIINTSSDDLVHINVNEHEIKHKNDINSENIEFTSDNHGDELSQHKVITPRNGVNDRATYSQLCEITSQLVIAVVNNKEKSNSVMSHVTEWLRKLRINDNFQPTFTTMNNNKTNATSSTSTSLSNVIPMSAVASAAKPDHCNKYYFHRQNL